MRVKDWNKFQHYKHRDPPWIRLYRGLLNDRQWHALSGDAAKALISIWLIAAESDGEIPPIEDLAFRLRMSEKQTISILSELSHWITEDDASNTLAPCERPASTTLATCEQLATPETETETETESICAVPSGTRTLKLQFEDFWKAKPSRKGANPKATAFKAFQRAIKAGADPPDIVAAARKWASDEGKNIGTEFIPHAATWLNQQRFEDYRPSREDREKSANLEGSMAAKGYIWNGEKWERTAA